MRAILQYLGARGVLAWRMNVGAVRSEFNGSARFVRFGRKGMSDIIGVVRTTDGIHAGPTIGRFLSIEVKQPGKHPTPYQVAFLEQVRKAGGIAFVATSVADVERELFA